MDEYNYISFGSDCYPAFALRDLGLRPYALPFDWIVSSIDTIIECINDDFLFFHKNLNLSSSRLCDKYGLLYVHDYPTENEKRNDIDNDSTIFYSENKIVSNWMDYNDTVLEKYKRRIQRFYEIANSDKPLFVLYKGDINNIPKIKNMFYNKFNKTNIIYIVFSSQESNSDDIICCNPGIQNTSSEWLYAINIGKTKVSL
jgi:hypothetical protein